VCVCVKNRSGQRSSLSCIILCRCLLYQCSMLKGEWSPQESCCSLGHLFVVAIQLFWACQVAVVTVDSSNCTLLPKLSLCRHVQKGVRLFSLCVCPHDSDFGATNESVSAV
jgi:hypothetical protein